MPAARKSARSAASSVFSAEEKAAMRELVKERKAGTGKAAIDDGEVFPTYFAVKSLATTADETRIAELIRTAVG
ncbi:MAG: hypothetical protein ACYDAC_01080 [Candidatus Dormibacteria bacterium]